MAYLAKIYLQRPGDDGALWCGTRKINALPARHVEVAFKHKGKVETGHIALIGPECWDQEGRTPAILVVQD